MQRSGSHLGAANKRTLNTPSRDFRATLFDPCAPVHGASYEIGIRTALGAHPRRVLLNVLARAIRQLALGVLVGSLLSASVFVAIGLGLPRATPFLLAVAIVMLVVGLLATLGPARRGLRIQAVEALRADA